MERNIIFYSFGQLLALIKFFHYISTKLVEGIFVPDFARDFAISMINKDN